MQELLKFYRINYVKEFNPVDLPDVKTKTDKKKEWELMSRININTDDREQLMTIKKIGGSKADNIIEYRERNGGFDNIEQLLQVRGIGSGILENIREEVTAGKGSEQKVKIEFNPDDYLLGDVSEVHLVGEMNNWDPADKSFALRRNQDGIWEGSFDLEKGMEYKIMYDSESWEAGKHIGDGEDNLLI